VRALIAAQEPDAPEIVSLDRLIERLSQDERPAGSA
jgi:hypothetical protein